MGDFLRSNYRTVALVAVMAALVATPALAVYAENADKVDGFHAVGGGASITARKGRLVATGATTGRLPNNIIAKAPDSAELGGRPAAAYATLAFLSAPGTVNAPSNPVEWSKLKGLPGGFADGVDDVGTTAEDLDCSGCVDSSDLASAAVAEAKLSFDPATQAELNTHKGSADHDSRYFTEAEVGSPGAINAASNPVHWTKLVGVPGGFADGTDADTTYAAGTGLTLAGTTFSVNPTQIQSRVAGTCVAGQAIRAVNADGTVTCEAVAGGGGWGLTGNSGTNPATQFIGTTDNQPLIFKANNLRVLRLEPGSNLIAGSSANSVSAGATGAAIGGGGTGGKGNVVTDDYGVVSGGLGNRAGDNAGTTSDRIAPTVGGGFGNVASGDAGTVAGGVSNSASGELAFTGGGQGNVVSGAAATIAGGFMNAAAALRAFVGGGESNEAVGNYSTVGGGLRNRAAAAYATIAGGGPADPVNPLTTRNEVTDAYGTVGGGADNRAGDGAGTTTDKEYATVAGGVHNVASGSSSTIGGGFENVATASGATVAGGLANQASSDQAFIGGGWTNIASGAAATVGGGYGNWAAQRWSTIAGGTGNNVSTADGTNEAAVVGGGSHNEASRSYATISGGTSNLATGRFSTIAGGDDNAASGEHSAVGGGGDNIASGPVATVAGGGFNSATGQNSSVGGGFQNGAGGLLATVPGGYTNTADGAYSFAAGHRGKANHPGAFVWSDAAPFDFPSSGDNTFNVRATGGARFVSATDAATGAPTAGVFLASGGGSWSSLSDRASKENFVPTDVATVLERLMGIEISTWSYKAQPDRIRHMGPTAQDFYRAFGLGESRRRISTVDADGVAFAAIQALYEALIDKDTDVRRLKAQAARQRDRISTLETRIARIERLLSHAGR